MGILKNVLKKKGDAINLKACLIQLNSLQRAGDGGSATEMFLGRAARNMLPGSRRMPRQEELIQKRRETLEKLYRKRRNTSKEKFQVGDPVWLQDPASKKWCQRGVITEARTNQDGRQTTFLVTGDSGRTYLRNECMLQLALPDDPTQSDNE